MRERNALQLIQFQYFDIFWTSYFRLPKHGKPEIYSHGSHFITGHHKRDRPRGDRKFEKSG